METDEDAVKHRKQARLSIHAFICAIDNQLRVVTGRGLQACVAPSAWEEVRAVLDQIDLQGREIPFPLLSLCVDQGSDGWGAWWYLCYGANCRTAILRDPSHRLHNDLELALKGSKLWIFVLTMMVCFNLHWGPWEGCRWQHLWPFWLKPMTRA